MQQHARQLPRQSAGVVTGQAHDQQDEPPLLCLPRPRRYRYSFKSKEKKWFSGTGKMQGQANVKGRCKEV
eukprot:763904-Hanusia_phi.AAC.2